MPVYRTCVRAADGFVAPGDAALISKMVERAAAGRPDLDPELFELLGRVLRLELDGPLAHELAMRFQQLTPPAMAKGVEDTSFYRHHRLVALNEVGGDPGRFGVSAGDFHRAMQEAARTWPAAGLVLSTHDTKRSADVRARLAIVTADPAGWRVLVERWIELSAAYRTDSERPTDADAYLLLQVLVGAWPIDADRAAAYMAKATHEAKLRTSWTAPDAAYDAAVVRFVRESLADASVVGVLEAFVADLAEAGWRAALAQVTLHLTAPGVPDVYQGASSGISRWSTPTTAARSTTTSGDGCWTRQVTSVRPPPGSVATGACRSCGCIGVSSSCGRGVRMRLPRAHPTSRSEPTAPLPTSVAVPSWLPSRWFPSQRRPTSS